MSACSASRARGLPIGLRSTHPSARLQASQMFSMPSSLRSSPRAGLDFSADSEIHQTSEFRAPAALCQSQSRYIMGKQQWVCLLSSCRSSQVSQPCCGCPFHCRCGKEHVCSWGRVKGNLTHHVLLQSQDLCLLVLRQPSNLLRRELHHLLQQCCNMTHNVQLTSKRKSTPGSRPTSSHPFHGAVWLSWHARKGALHLPNALCSRLTLCAT